MEFFTKRLSLVALALLSMLALYGRLVDACMCMPSHPQTHYCDADYVVQLRVVRKSNKIEPGKTVYKVNINRTYKATPEARKMLREGRLASYRDDGMCGVQLHVGRVYVIAGRLPQLNLCSYFKEYTKMSVTERHGFNGAYGQACSCKAKPCFGKQCLQPNTDTDVCQWSPVSKCEGVYSACMPHKVHTRNGDFQRCRWRRTRLYKKCLSYP